MSSKNKELREMFSENYCIDEGKKQKLYVKVDDFESYEILEII